MQKSYSFPQYPQCQVGTIVETVDKGDLLLKKTNESQKGERTVRSSKGKTVDKKNRQRRRIPGRVTLLFLALILAFFGLFWYSTKDATSSSLFKRLDLARNSGLPYMVVVYEDHTNAGSESVGSLKGIASSADRLVPVFLERYDLDHPDKSVLYFIDYYGLETLPSVVLVDGKDKVRKIYPLPLDPESIQKDLEALIQEAKESVAK